MHLASEDFPLHATSFPRVLHITVVYGTPELREGFANSCPMAGNAPNNLRARWGWKFSQRLREFQADLLTCSINTLTYPRPTLDSPRLWPAGTQLHDQFREP